MTHYKCINCAKVYGSIGEGEDSRCPNCGYDTWHPLGLVTKNRVPPTDWRNRTCGECGYAHDWNFGNSTVGLICRNHGAGGDCWPEVTEGMEACPDFVAKEISHE